MIIKQEFPPFQLQIPHRKGNIYCYGETIYSPDSKEIPEDIQKHESIHSKQQSNFTSPDVWWNRYYLDPQFRLSQELEAYAHQLNWIKKHIPGASEEALDEMAHNLTEIYSLPINHNQAKIKIRRMSRWV